MLRLLLPLGCLVLLAGPGRADPPSSQDVEFFEAKIRPLFAENCFKCHSAKEKVRGGLRLDERSLFRKGGDSGPVVVNGAPEKSPLIRAVSYGDPELRMPPRGKLPQEQIDLLTEWVRRGAPWPEEKTGKTLIKAFDLKERSKHWSLQPLKAAAVPTLKRKDWARGDIDRFILAALEAKGLTPADQADRQTLLRRVTFDLTGLPPTPAEIDAFLNDKADDAYEKVVERLLASPRYGERWARHWLDLVRYAETLGHEFDFDIPDAWRYRDYAIRAFNADVPFDQLVREHVAGDLLPEPRRHPVDKTNESILGTMFWLFGEAKHSPVDSKSDYADRMDNQIDVFSKTFLGLTVACARCHDHKFDAISTKDYHALLGYLQSSRPDWALLDDPAPRRAILEKNRDLLERAHQLASKQAIEHLRAGGKLPSAMLHNLLEEPGVKKIASSDEDYSRRRKVILEQMQAQQARHDEMIKRTLVLADAGRDGFRDWIPSGEAFSFSPKSPPLLFNFASPLAVGKVLNPSRAGGDPHLDDAVGALRSPTFTITKKKIHYKAAGRDVRVNLILDGLQLIRDPIYGGLTFTVNTKAVPTPAHPKAPFALSEVRESQWHTQDVSMWLGHRAYIEVLDEGKGHVTLDQVVFSDEGPPPAAPNRLLLDLLADAKHTSWERLEGGFQHLAGQTLDAWEKGTLGDRPDGADRVQIINGLLQHATAGGASKRDAWEEITAEYHKRPRLPAPTRAMALCDGSAVNERIFIRGNPKNPGEEAPRRFLEVFGGATPGADEKGSGRLDLARHMLDPDKTPVLPRVIVNRLWKHHFGEGIVRSVDDFGLLGQAPTHPELLDWLALEFIKQGWSFKKMHREMLLSATYRMSSKADKAADEADPDNRHLHRMPVRRLEAEAIRDALLAISGRLDETRFGPPVPPHLTPHMQGRGRPGVSGPLDGNGRRSIYLGVRRNFLNPMFLAFDFPTPFSTMGRRGVSNVPAQALTMLNNPLVLQQAEVWAKKTLAEPGVDRKTRVERMYVAALGRGPQAAELDAALQFLDEETRVHGRPDDPRAWTELGHVIFNLKEFLFVP